MGSFRQPGGIYTRPPVAPFQRSAPSEAPKARAPFGPSAWAPPSQPNAPFGRQANPAFARMQYYANQAEFCRNQTWAQYGSIMTDPCLSTSDKAFYGAELASRWAGRQQDLLNQQLAESEAIEDPGVRASYQASIKSQIRRAESFRRMMLEIAECLFKSRHDLIHRIFSGR